MDSVTDVSCSRDIFVGKKDGKVREIRFNMLPHESVFVELLSNNLNDINIKS